MWRLSVTPKELQDDDVIENIECSNSSYGPVLITKNYKFAVPGRLVDQIYCVGKYKNMK